MSDEVEETKTKERTDEMNAVNTAVISAIESISEEFGMKLSIVGYSIKHDVLGLWKSKNVNQLDEMGFAKVLSETA